MEYQVAKERKEIRKPFIAKTDEILKAFGNGFTLKMNGENSYDFRPEIIGSDSKRFQLRFGDCYGTKPDRIVISYYPGHEFAQHRSSYSDGPSPEITVSLNKTGEQIKRDIEKRLFPGAKELLNKLIERKSIHDLTVAQLRSRILKVEENTKFRLGNNHQKDDTSAKLHLWESNGVYGDIGLSGSKEESFTLELRGLKLYQILAISKLI